MIQLRRRLTDELLELAQHLNDPWLSFWAASRQWEVAIETGDRAQAESALAHVASGDYAGEHWLASFAVYMLSTPSPEIAARLWK